MRRRVGGRVERRERRRTKMRMRRRVRRRVRSRVRTRVRRRGRESTHPRLCTTWEALMTLHPSSSPSSPLPLSSCRRRPPVRRAPGRGGGAAHPELLPLDQYPGHCHPHPRLVWGGGSCRPVARTHRQTAPDAGVPAAASVLNERGRARYRVDCVADKLRGSRHEVVGVTRGEIRSRSCCW